MKEFPMFDNIEYTEDIETLRKWVPLMMEGRVDDGKMAASKIDEGTDVNFGELTRKMTKISKHIQMLKFTLTMKCLISIVLKTVNGK